ncbi:phage integrase SAM-like domain-containing protein [uncultured Alistipes sp.]|uniref:phage integrase SAM-like domain-containing protein n=1 Tax=Bacteroidales TaxID=171549 RepID=UPI003458B939
MDASRVIPLLRESLSRNATVAQVFDLLIEESKNHRRVRNGHIFSSQATAWHLAGARRTLEDFTMSQHRRKFSRYRFQDIDANFLLDYTLYLERRYATTIKKTGVRAKLLSLYSVFIRAQKRGVYSVDITVFRVVKSKLKQPRLFSKAVTHETMMKIEQ